MFFVCTGCHVNPGSGAWAEAPSTRSKKGSKEKDNENETTGLKQLYMTVKALTSEMAKLPAKLGEVTTKGSMSFAQATATPHIPNAPREAMSCSVPSGLSCFASSSWWSQGLSRLEL